MKNIIKAAVIVALFIVFIGSIGACEQNRITMLQCLVQGSLCSLGTCVLLKGVAK